MKKFLQKLSVRMEDGAGVSVKDKFLAFTTNHPQVVALSLLTIACLFFLFWGLSFYPLMDVDETRYAVMSRDLAYSFDWNSLMLNAAPFLEKPPLYFWLVATSIKLFGGLSGFAARFPIALLSSFLVFFTYYIGKKVISIKYGTISALVLLSSIFFLILSHVAIIDMVLTVFMTSALYCAFLTHFCQEKNKKYFWWYCYLFIGLGFLAKGLLALAIPAVIILIYGLITKTAKDIFKPVNILPGLVILFTMILPWHLIMYKEYGYQFIKEYFLMHHFARFINSVSIGRERPFLYFVPVFLLGFMPWTFIFIAAFIDGSKKLVAKYKATEGKIKEKITALFETTTNEQKLILFSVIYFVVVFLVFSTSSTKLPTYILPIFPAAAFLTGYYWWISDEKGENEKAISVSTMIFATILIVAAMASSVGFFMLPYDLQFKFAGFKEITITSLYLLAIFLLLRLNTKRALSVFSGYVLVMVFVIALSVSKIFNFVYSTGENEIVQYSIISAQPDDLSRLVTFDFSVKPSALIQHPTKIDFLTDEDFNQLDQLLEYKAGPTYVIVKNKNFEKSKDYRAKIEKRLELVEPGEKYSLYVKDVNNQYNNRPKNLSGMDEWFRMGKIPPMSHYKK